MNFQECANCDASISFTNKNTTDEKLAASTSEGAVYKPYKIRGNDRRFLYENF